jgi:hypothetical protein
VSAGPTRGQRASPDSDAWSPDEEATCWREATRLRREHPKWVVIWLASAREFRAYRRMPGARRDTVLTASTPDDLSAQIAEAERVSTSGPSDA